MPGAVLPLLNAAVLDPARAAGKPSPHLAARRLSLHGRIRSPLSVMERDGERENTQGRARQATNDAMEDTEGAGGRTLGDRSGYVTSLYDSPDSAERAYRSLTDSHATRLTISMCS